MIRNPFSIPFHTFSTKYTQLQHNHNTTMSLLTSSTTGTPKHPRIPPDTLVDPFKTRPSSDFAVENHLRIGSIALLCQNSRSRTKIQCARPDHCGGNLLQFESSQNPVVILQRKFNNDSGDTESCLVAWVCICSSACTIPELMLGYR